MTKNNPAEIEFDARNVPISKRFDDPYFSFHNGLAESEYVFLKGNDLPQRLQGGFQIAELGFGTGLNFLLSWRAWRQKNAEGKIHFTSFEAFPMNAHDRARALSHFDEIEPLITEFMSDFDGQKFEREEITLNVILGDARETLPPWAGRADAWFLDGFSPAKNPELWDEKLMKQVFNHCQPRAGFATFSAAGFVRRNLEAAGFLVERSKGFGHKRHMLKGHAP